LLVTKLSVQDNFQIPDKYTTFSQKTQTKKPVEDIACTGFGFIWEL